MKRQTDPNARDRDAAENRSVCSVRMACGRSSELTAPIRCPVACFRQIFHRQLRAGLRLLDAFALAADALRQAFQRLGSAHHLGSAVDAQGEGALPPGRAKIEVAGFHCPALLNRGSGRENWHGHRGNGEQGMDELHDRFLQQAPPTNLSGDAAQLAVTQPSCFAVLKSGWSCFERYKADGIRTGCAIPESACRSSRALATKRS